MPICAPKTMALNAKAVTKVLVDADDACDISDLDYS